jgi:TolB-like protein/class 3 adenylate cyclase/Tfp pilus assembly protein PilF
MASTRRLAAILAADVAGYSRLMGVDEEGTHERLRAHFRELVDPKIADDHGRIVKNTGDGFLAEFASVVDAVRCAVEVQRGMADRNRETPEDERITFRMGINLGDVIVEDNDIYGDGVNIAARLEGLAEPGGICISRVVREQIQDRLPYPFESKGEQNVKNIRRPVRVYTLRLEAVGGRPASSTALATPIPQSAKVPRLSIVVLPFANLSNDPEQQYLADGIAEDLTTDLSRIAGMVVISRTTAFTYRNRPIDIRQIGRELNVRYVLEGSIRRSGDRIRCNAQLIDAESDSHIWAERFDLFADDLLWLQDEVTGRIAIALDLELVKLEAARPGENPDAFEYILRARSALNRDSTRDSFAEAISLCESALALDPASIQARAHLARALTLRVMEQMTDTPAADLERAEMLIADVLATSPHDPIAHAVRGELLRSQGRYEAAIPEYERAVALDRNYAGAIATLGLCKFFAGAIEEAIPAQEQAIRLSPRDPRLPNWYWRIGMAHLLKARVDDAISWLEKARSANPRLAGPRAWLASAYALAGNGEGAATELDEARRLSGDNRYASIAGFKRTAAFGPKTTQALAEETFLAGLRKVGVPEE